MCCNESVPCFFVYPTYIDTRTVLLPPWLGCAALHSRLNTTDTIFEDWFFAAPTSANHHWGCRDLPVTRALPLPPGGHSCPGQPRKMSRTPFCPSPSNKPSLYRCLLILNYSAISEYVCPFSTHSLVARSLCARFRLVMPETSHADVSEIRHGFMSDVR
jgi:hypothetical protein